MSRAHPLAEQCTATSKRTGERCQLNVIGGGPCRWHGGNAPQVKAKREVRILTAEAALEAPKTMAEASDVLLSAMNDSHALLQRLKQNIAAGTITAADMSALGDWVDRSARVSKLVIDTGIHERQVRLAEGQGALIAQVIQRLLDRLVLDERQRALVPIVVPELLRSVEGPPALESGR